MNEIVCHRESHLALPLCLLIAKTKRWFITIKAAQRMLNDGEAVQHPLSSVDILSL